MDTNVLTFTSRAKLREAVLDPERKLAMLDNPLTPISPRAAEALALGWEGKDSPAVYKTIKDESIRNSNIWYWLGLQLFELGRHPESFDCFEKVSGREREGLEKFAALVWMGQLMDLQKQRDKAIEYYQKAIEYDTGETMTHSQYGMQINRQLVEERLRTPFVRNR